MVIKKIISSVGSLMPNIQYITLRLWAVLKKEFIQMKRDFATYIFLIMMPLFQVVFFGYIINADAKNLPTMIVAHDSTPFTHSLIQAFKNTQYFDIQRITVDDNEGKQALKSGKMQFVINIPAHFSRDLLRNRNPHILVEGDASDPIAVGNAFSAASVLSNRALNQNLQGELRYLLPKSPAFSVDTHSQYNPALLAQYHTLPGLLTTILTLTLVMLTAISITTENEQNTMENLLITPIKPIEVILGKIIPHVILGYLLFFLTLALSYWLFKVPFYGSLLLLVIVTIPYLIANLGIGVAVSIVSRTQLRAANIANSYILPSVLLSGFLFPFYAMPKWAQFVGNIFPPSHYLRITTAIMLKGATFLDILPDLWPILAFMVVIIYISLRYYRETLD